MVLETIQNHIFMSSICFVGALSIIIQWLITLSLKGYVKASSNMKTTKKKTMVNLKNQFEAIYEMNSQVRNMDAYVDKYLLKLRFMGITYTGWERLPFLTAGVTTILAIVGGFFGYLNKSDSTYYAEIIFSYGITLACLFMFFHIFGIKTRKQQIHIQLVDYLENYLSNRLLKGKNDKWKTMDDEVEKVFEKSDDNSSIEGYKENDRRTMEEDMDMLKRLIKEMDTKKDEENVHNEVAIASEDVGDGLGEEILQTELEQSDAELLEEFVQSFLS